MARTLARIVPSCVVEPVQRMFEGGAAAELITGAWAPGGRLTPPLDAAALAAGAPAYVLDCIDDTATKAALLHFCYSHAIPVLSSLGAGGRADPTKLAIADLATIRTEPMAIALKQHMRKAGLCGMGGGGGGGGGGGAAAAAAAATVPAMDEAPAAGTLGYMAARDPLRGTLTPADLATLGNPGRKVMPAPAGADRAQAEAARMTGIMAVYSMEVQPVSLLPLPGDAAAGDKPADFGAMPGFRVRVMPVLGPLPSIFGLTLATYTLVALAGRTADLLPIDAPPLPPAALVKLQGRFGELDTRTYLSPRNSLSAEEVAFLVNDVWRQRSGLSPADRVGVKGVELALSRWRRGGGSTPANIVLVTEEQAAWLSGAHAPLDDAEFDAAVAATFGAAAAATVHARLAWVRGQGYP